MSKQQERKILVRDLWTIRLHWFNAVCWLVLVATGLGIISGDSLRLAPAFWPEFLQKLAGGNANLVQFHALVGITWVTGIALFALMRWKGVVSPFLKQVLVLRPRAVLRETRSMMITLARLFGMMKATPVPPAGRYNGAQRLLGTLIIVASLGIAASGLYLYFAAGFFDFASSPFYGALFRWALVLHAAAVFLVLIGLVAHIYFAIVEEPECLESMKSGYASVDFIEHHAPLWYEELKRDGRI